ncbi:MAG: cyclic nucleotide-binding domain-containing protein [Deltaproteobacteria bacterium]|nr:cyclic nucleotide-binding domain-containing protein [Deltaproteobacteria bacterium]
MISTIERVVFLRSVDLFRHIPGEILARVAEIAQEVRFAPNDEIIREGASGDAMFLLIEGYVDVVKGDRLVVTLGPKECVGEMALLDSEPRSATVRCKEAVHALQILREDFYDLMGGHVEIARGVIKILIQRLRKTTGS